MANKKKKGDKKEFIINFDTLGVPIAIVISGIIITALVFLSSKDDTTNDIAEMDDTTQVEGDTTESNPSSQVTLGDDPYLGDISSAKVAVIEFSDYQCSYCQRHGEETFPSIKENYIDTGKIIYVFKEFPLSSVGQIGYLTAEGAACVFNLSDSQTYAEYHKRAFFFENKSESVTLAKELGIGESEFTACLDEGRYRDEIDADLSEGRSAGISGTPGFIVGLIGEDGVVEGELIAGAYPYETFSAAIEKLLKE